MQDFELGEIWGRKYKHFIQSISSESRIYAISANTSCHYSSIYNNLAGMFLGVKSKDVYSESQGIFQLPPGGKVNHYENSENHALFHGFYPVRIKQDSKDHLFQLRTCKRLHQTIEHASFIAMRKYSNNKLIKDHLAEIYKNNPKLTELYESD